MIPKELRQKIKRIEITTNRLVTDILAGQYVSAFKGRGMEFSEVREYIPGDDIRTIDWNVTARYNRPFVKQFVEERELTVMFLHDVSGSQTFGSAVQLKSELSAEISAILAFAAIRSNDQVGSILFSDHVENFIPPQKGAKHVLRVVRDLLAFKPTGTGTKIETALEYLERVQKRRAVVFIVSDFLDEGYEKAMRIAARYHDIVALIIEDPRELELPQVRYFSFVDCETNQLACVDLSNKKIREQFKILKSQAIEKRDRFLASAGIDCLKIRTDQPYEVALQRFLKMRSRRMH